MSFRWLLVAGPLAVSVASCSKQIEGSDGNAPGEAVEALAGACCITDVETDPRTYHFDSPRWVLQAAEGVGPRTLALTIAGYASPLFTTNEAQHPKENELAAAVGYNLGVFYYLQGSVAYTVDVGHSKRLEAYINYARSAWTIREAGCGAILGQGVSFKPIGIYFAVRDVVGTALPGSSTIGILPVGAGGPGGYPPYPTLLPPQTGIDGPGAAAMNDAAMNDAGPSDAAASDAGHR